MCGISGMYVFDRDGPASVDHVLGMTNRLIHRGPDGGGLVDLGPVVLGHRRLSILDLSDAGHQPMSFGGGRYWITFNGEIYNYRALRQELQSRGITFRSETDTEVILALYQESGLEGLRRLNGMYALALYDRDVHEMVLMRDRVGKKPLYLWETREAVYFASELKAFFAVPEFSPDVRPESIPDFLSTLYIPDPHSVFRQVTRLPPATLVRWIGGIKTSTRYWWPLAHPGEAPATSWRGPAAAVEEFEDLFRQAVGGRMVADVPLGAFLSGGVDSSAVVSEMVRHSTAPIKTTAIGFDDREEDESEYAEAIAAWFGCDHRTVRLEAPSPDLLESILGSFDEPFADSSALPTWLLCRETRRQVTVALSGDGGDEAFGGYGKYCADIRERRWRSFLPRPAWARLGRLWEKGGGRGFPIGRRASNLLRSLGEDPAAAWFRTQSFTAPEEVLGLLSPDFRASLRDHDPSEPTRRALLQAGHADPLTALQVCDLETFLPGDILTKVDRMSMAHSLEVRCPLLDPSLIEFALRLPPEWRIQGTATKRLLKAAVAPRMPTGFLERKKHGFTVPIGRWFDGPTGDQLREQLHDGVLGNSGILDVRRAGSLLAEHRSGRVRAGMTLWSLLVLAVWYERSRSDLPIRSPEGCHTRIERRGPAQRFSGQAADPGLSTVPGLSTDPGGAHA